MQFLLASIFLLGANLYAFQRGLKATPKTFFGVFAAFLHLVLVQLFCAAFVWTLVVSPRYDTTDWFVATAFVLGLGSLLLFGWRLVSTYRADASRLSWRAGLTLWAAMAGGYTLFTAGDHWWFLGDSDKAGLADASVLGVDDVDCGRMVAVNFEGEVAIWRCPMGVSIGGSRSGKPFIPWPAYRQGESAELKQALKRVLAEAKAE